MTRFVVNDSANDAANDAANNATGRRVRTRGGMSLQGPVWGAPSRALRMGCSAPRLFVGMPVYITCDVNRDNNLGGPRDARPTAGNREEGAMARFDLNLLGALDALLTEQNVTRAAEALHVTQPTMSGMLQRLRYQFDDPLLVRNGRGMVLTRFAASLVGPVREALKGVGSLVVADTAFDPVTSTRTFTMMASHSCVATLLPRLMAYMTTVAPSMRLVVRAQHEALERLAVGDVDICITTDACGVPPGREAAMRDTDPERKLQSEQLLSDDLVCVAGRTHPFRPRSGREAYFASPHIGVEMAGVSDAIVTAHKAHLADYRPAFVVADFSAIPHLVENTSAIGIVPRTLAMSALRTHDIRVFSAPIDVPSISQTLRWHVRHLDDPAHKWLRDLLLQGAHIWSEAPLDPADAGARGETRVGACAAPHAQAAA